MTILITGSTGGFGRLFSDWAERNMAEEVMLSGRAALSRARYVPCNLERPEEIRALIAQVRPRLVFHFAGSFANDYERDYAVNTYSAKCIFDTLLAERLSTRVVLFGSAAEYGVVAPEENPIRESHVLRPVSIYGMTKAYQTQMAYYYAHNHNIDVVVARVFNLRVPGLSERLFFGRVERMIEQVQRGEIDVIELGSLESVRDYVAGDEAIRQVNLIAERGRPGEVYHVGSGQPLRMRDLLDQMLSEAGLDWSAVRTRKGDGSRIGYDVPAIFADMSRACALSED